MAVTMVGDQWNEGDVSCSVVRRVALPGSFYTIDGQIESFLSILETITFDKKEIQKEVSKNLPYLITTNLLMKAVEKGMGREDAHKILKTHISKVKNFNLEKFSNDLINDRNFPLNKEEIHFIIDNPELLKGEANVQIDQFIKISNKWINKYPLSKKLLSNQII